MFWKKKKKRKFPRLNTDQITKITKVKVEEGEEPAKGAIRNVSKGGVFLVSTEFYPLGTVLEFTIHLPNHLEDLHAMGIVKWVNKKSDPKGIGIEFMLVDPEGRKALYEYIEAYVEEPEEEENV